jgi:hypothetical protein
MKDLAEYFSDKNGQIPGWCASAFLTEPTTVALFFLIAIYHP